MDGNKTSDIDPTMLASKTFDRIIHLIQQSNLNFVLQVSPFSANIALKKSLVQDKSGRVRLPPQEHLNVAEENSKDVIDALVVKNIELENLVTSLRHDLGASNKVCEKESEDRMLREGLEHEVHNLRVENKKYTEKTIKQEEELINLEKIVRTKFEIANRLNRELSEPKTKNEKESALNKKNTKMN